MSFDRWEDEQDEGGAEQGPDIRTWRDGSPASVARAAAAWAEVAEFAAQVNTDALDRPARIGALARIVLWIEADMVWRSECWHDGPGYSALCDFAELAGVHGFGRHVAAVRARIAEGTEAAERARRQARAAARGGCGARRTCCVGTGRTRRRPRWWTS